jgi:isocitrate dehydrogenase (NAD+)
MIDATLLPGDGIGPEITEAVVDILDHLGAPSNGTRTLPGLPRSTATAIRYRRKRSTASSAPVSP